MPTEYAASFPTEATRCLVSYRKRVNKFLPGNHNLRKKITLDYEYKANGIVEWDINVSSEIQEKIESYRNKLISSLSAKGKDVLKEIQSTYDWGVCWIYYDEYDKPLFEIEVQQNPHDDLKRVGVITDEDYDLIKSICLI